MVIVKEAGVLKTKDTWETLNRQVFYVTNCNRMRVVIVPLAGESRNDIW